MWLLHSIQIQVSSTFLRVLFSSAWSRYLTTTPTFWLNWERKESTSFLARTQIFTAFCLELSHMITCLAARELGKCSPYSG